MDKVGDLIRHVYVLYIVLVEFHEKAGKLISSDPVSFALNLLNTHLEQSVRLPWATVTLLGKLVFHTLI